MSATLLKNLTSFSDPCGPPSALDPLSEISMMSVLSYSPRSFRNSDHLTNVAVGMRQEPAKTSIMRA